MKLNLNKIEIKKYQSTGCRIILLAACSLFLFSSFPSYAKKIKPKVYIKSLKASRYQLIVEGKPYIVKGVCYNPIPIGQNYDYDWWSDPYKPWLVDGKLMKEMGVNTVRVYKPGDNPEAVRQVIRDFYEQFGIRTILGHWLGFWEYPCPLYGDKEFHQRVKKEVLEMVNNFKDEPGVLLWILGNENNYSCLGHVNPWSTLEIDQEPDPQKQKCMRAQIYYSFVNELAKEIKRIDPNHPVALGNGELIMLDIAQKYCPDVDLIACIIYRGKSFGNFFKSLKATFDRPVLLSEFGADAYDALKQKEAQDMQAFFLEAQWRQIFDNLASSRKGEGNCLGGTMFEWTDEWWKHNPTDYEGLSKHDTESNWSNGSYYFDIEAPRNMNMNEEWFGIVALSDTEKEFGLDKRIPR
ncbi:MAG: hypothetical protein N2606_03725, partial [Candidatus Omnitrophica bacterium]|nr:hypothetical protein [Candidatus Omnitrophota bacterium]